jgi:hypothetical protein
MKRTARSYCAALALAGLAGCAWMYAPHTEVTGQQLQFRPGTGVVESIARAPAPFTAAAGGTAAAPDELNRLKIRMDDGRTQYLDTSDTGFAPGTRVRLTDERLIEKL